MSDIGHIILANAELRTFCVPTEFARRPKGSLGLGLTKDTFKELLNKLFA